MAYGEGSVRSRGADGRGMEKYPVWVRVGFWGCVAVAIAAVLRRAIALLGAPSQGAPLQLATLDAFFRNHATVTWIHILCALVYVALLPFVFWRRTRGSRGLERVFFVLGFAVGITAYAMTTYAVGGWIERSAVLVFNTLFVVSMLRAFVLRRQGDDAAKRRWMVRAVAILLGIATTRPVMGVFFATARVTHLTPHQFFGVAFWIGFSINTLVIELWLRHRGPEAGRML
ncbi:MAG TPA: DUF2306 domain-containing protein [Terracidiphilus sp.]|nr:DUF2306 domain-containing protein [Terracidiphilus sp.]